MSRQKSCRAVYVDDAEHPWDEDLRTHVLKVHGSDIRALMQDRVTARYTRFPDHQHYDPTLHTS